MAAYHRVMLKWFVLAFLLAHRNGSVFGGAGLLFADKTDEAESTKKALTQCKTRLENSKLLLESCQSRAAAYEGIVQRIEEENNAKQSEINRRDEQIKAQQHFMEEKKAIINMLQEALPARQARAHTEAQFDSLEKHLNHKLERMVKEINSDMEDLEHKISDALDEMSKEAQKLPEKEDSQGRLASQKIQTALLLTVLFLVLLIVFWIVCMMCWWHFERREMETKKSANKTPTIPAADPGSKSVRKDPGSPDSIGEATSRDNESEPKPVKKAVTRTNRVRQRETAASCKSSNESGELEADNEQ